MLKNLLKLLPIRPKTAKRPDERVFKIAAPDKIDAPGFESLDFAVNLQFVNGLPVPNWPTVHSWVESITDTNVQASAWISAELAWLGHLQQALGPHYYCVQHEQAIVLSALEPNVANATAQYMTKTLARIHKVLEGIAQPPAYGKDILLVFEDEDSYYRYVSRYYSVDGEFALSSGMHINWGCGHFVALQADMRVIEPVIAHEMTHGCLSHLPIPAWLNEGLAVKTERRLSPSPGYQYTPMQLR
jgi:hypothetical protein